MTLLHRGRRALRKLGLDVGRYPDEYRPNDVVKLMRHHDIDAVLDIGANTGQHARELRELGYTKTIISCEPLTQAYAELARTSATDPLWTALHTAVGDQTGYVDINIAANSVSSSVLRMLDRHVHSAPQSRYVGSETVPVTTLSSLTAELPHNRVFAKVDTQGYERQVLRGADLGRLLGVQLELSLVPLYEGGMLVEEGLEVMTGAGFGLMSLLPGFTDTASGQMLQCDAVFFRP